MATNLFNKYYTNPKRQYMLSGMTCKTPGSADTIFSISGSAATISNSEKTLASLDLSTIQEPLAEWRNETRTIEPYSFVYFKGFDCGWAYQRNAFIKIPDELVNDPDFEYITGVSFDIYVYKDGYAQKETITAQGDLDTETSFISNVQDILDEKEIAVNFTVEGNLCILTSTVLGREFYVSVGKEHSNAIHMFTTSKGMQEDLLDFNLYDYPAAYVPYKKYRNGAFKGVVIKPTYPEYNADNIKDESRSLQLGLLPDRVELDKPVFDGKRIVYDKKIFDLDDSYSDIVEKQQWDRVRSTDYVNPQEYDIDGCNSSNIMGLYGYIAWAKKNNKLTNVGPFYACLENTDVADTSHKNLHPSFVLYNPNEFPVQVSFMSYC